MARGAGIVLHRWVLGDHAVTHAHHWKVEAPDEAVSAGRDHLEARCTGCRARREYQLRPDVVYAGAFTDHPTAVRRRDAALKARQVG